MKMNTINHKASKYHEQYIEKVKRINVIIGKGIQGHKCNDWIHGITIQQGGWCTKMVVETITIDQHVSSKKLKN